MYDGESKFALIIYCTLVFSGVWLPSEAYVCGVGVGRMVDGVMPRAGRNLLAFPSWHPCSTALLMRRRYNVPECLQLI